MCPPPPPPQAKTIDLCNNPLTKEPKLQSARRIIAEWPDLDREAVEFTAAVDRVQVGPRRAAAQGGEGAQSGAMQVGKVVLGGGRGPCKAT